MEFENSKDLNVTKTTEKNVYYIYILTDWINRKP